MPDYDGCLLPLVHDLGKRMLPAFTRGTEFPFAWVRPYVMFVAAACFHHHGPISALGESEKRCSTRGDPRNVHRWSVQFLAALHHQCTLAIVILSVLLSVVIRSWNLTAGVWSSIPSHGRSNLLRGCRPSMCEDCSHANTVEFIDEMFACRL